MRWGIRRKWDREDADGVEGEAGGAGYVVDVEVWAVADVDEGSTRRRDGSVVDTLVECQAAHAFEGWWRVRALDCVLVVVIGFGFWLALRPYRAVVHSKRAVVVCYSKSRFNAAGVVLCQEDAVVQRSLESHVPLPQKF